MDDFESINTLYTPLHVIYIYIVIYIEWIIYIQIGLSPSLDPLSPTLMVKLYFNQI